MSGTPSSPEHEPPDGWLVDWLVAGEEPGPGANPVELAMNGIVRALQGPLATNEQAGEALATAAFEKFTKQRRPHHT
jgi:hypothetical protein